MSALALLGCLHDPANVQQTSSKRPALACVFWIHLLEVCWTSAGSCRPKHPISDIRGPGTGTVFFPETYSSLRSLTCFVPYYSMTIICTTTARCAWFLIALTTCHSKRGCRTCSRIDDFRFSTYVGRLADMEWSVWKTALHRHYRYFGASSSVVIDAGRWSLV